MIVSGVETAPVATSGFNGFNGELNKIVRICSSVQNRPGSELLPEQPSSKRKTVLGIPMRHRKRMGRSRAV